jgi:HMG (high mobility group) box
MSNDEHSCSDDRRSDIEAPSSPFEDDYWYGDADLTPGDIDDINAAAFATVSDNKVKPDCTSSASSGSGAPTVSRRRKKPKGFPKRPLSGYNLFFKDERVKILHEFSKDFEAVDDEEIRAIRSDADRAKVSFQDLGKIIGKRWKALSEKDRRKYDDLAEHDSCRYRDEMDEYNEAKRRKHEEKSRSSLPDNEDSKMPPSNVWSTMVLSRPPAFGSQSQLPVQARLPVEQNSHAPDPSNSHTGSWQYPMLHDCGETESQEKGFPFPIPPGTEIALPDQNGAERLYQVQYKFFKMSLKDAQGYMEQLAKTSTVTPYGFFDYPAPPQTAR